MCFSCPHCTAITTVQLKYPFLFFSLPLPLLPLRLLPLPLLLCLSGKRFVLTAGIGGFPFPKVQWWKDGELMLGETHLHLVVGRAAETDQAVYYATAQNDLGQVTTAGATVMVNDPPVFTRHPQGGTVRLMPGSSFTLSGSASGVPEPTYQWLRNELPAPGLDGRNATFIDVGNDAEGVYALLAMNSAGQATSTATKIEVLDLPAFLSYELSHSPIAIVGELVNISVTVVGDPAPTLTWSINGIVVDNETGSTFQFYADDAMAGAYPGDAADESSGSGSGSVGGTNAPRASNGDLIIVATATNVVGAVASEAIPITVQRTTTTTTSLTTTTLTTTTLTTTTQTTTTATSSTTTVAPKIVGDAAAGTRPPKWNDMGNDAATVADPFDDVTMEQARADAKTSSSFGPVLGGVVGVLCVAAVLVLTVVQKRRASDSALAAGLKIEYSSDDPGDDSGTPGNNSIIQNHMQVIQTHLQEFFTERETDGGGIHDTYALASMITVVPRQLRPRCIKVLEKIGAGQFGEVFRGELATSTRRGVAPTACAVKTMKKTDPSDKDVKSFLAEGALMAQFNHPNIIRLIGISASAESIQLVTELAAKGSLQHYLQTEPTTEPVRIQMAVEVAGGMQYLEHSGFIHRDLAARNVLVTATLNCKIGDFGLSRRLGIDDRMSGGVVAVRWTAPEVIRFKRYSKKTDVWSFGILMYEIWTKAGLPYGDAWGNTQVVQEVDRGYRLPCPADCDQEVYVLMMSCWHPTPKLRPPFSKLMTRLEHIVDAFQSEALDAGNNDMLKLKAIYMQSRELQHTLPLSPVPHQMSPLPQQMTPTRGGGSALDVMDRLARLELEAGVKSPVIVNKSPVPSPVVAPRHSRLFGKKPFGYGSKSRLSAGGSTGGGGSAQRSPAIATPTGLFRKSRTAYGNNRGSDLVEEPEEAWNQIADEEKQAGMGRLARFSQRLKKSFNAFAAFGSSSKRGSAELSSGDGGAEVAMYLQPGERVSNGSRMQLGASPDEQTYGSNEMQLPAPTVVVTSPSPTPGLVPMALLDNGSASGAGAGAGAVEQVQQPVMVEEDAYLNLDDSDDVDAAATNGHFLPEGTDEEEYKALIDLCQKLALPVTAASSSDSRGSVLIPEELFPILKTHQAMGPLRDQLRGGLGTATLRHTSQRHSLHNSTYQGVGFDAGSNDGDGDGDGDGDVPVYEEHDGAVADDSTLQLPRKDRLKAAQTVRISPNAGRKKGILLIKANLSEPEMLAEEMTWPDNKSVTPMVDCWELLRNTRQEAVKQAAMQAAQQQRKAAISRINQKYQSGEAEARLSRDDGGAATLGPHTDAGETAAAVPAPDPVQQEEHEQQQLGHATVVTATGMRTSPIVVHVPGDPTTMVPSPTAASCVVPSPGTAMPGRQRRSVLSPLSPSAANNLGDMIVRKDTMLKSHRKGKKAKKGGTRDRKETGVDNASAHRRRKKMVAQFEGSSKELAAHETVLNTIAQLERPTQKLQGVIRPDSKHFETVEYESLLAIRASAAADGAAAGAAAAAAALSRGVTADGVQLRKKKPSDRPVSIRTSVYL